MSMYQDQYYKFTRIAALTARRRHHSSLEGHVTWMSPGSLWQHFRVDAGLRASAKLIATCKSSTAPRDGFRKSGMTRCPQGRRGRSLGSSTAMLVPGDLLRSLWCTRCKTIQGATLQEPNAGQVLLYMHIDSSWASEACTSAYIHDFAFLKEGSWPLAA